MSPVESNAATLGRFKSSHPETVFLYQFVDFKQEISANSFPQADGEFYSDGCWHLFLSFH